MVEAKRNALDKCALGARRAWLSEPHRQMRGHSPPILLLRKDDALPTPAWTIPAFSTRNSTAPPLASLMALVNIRGNGADLRVRHQAARTQDLCRAGRPAASCRALRCSGRNRSCPFCTASTRSSAPTMSAPAALASSALSPLGENADADAWPVPFGSDTDTADHLVGMTRVNAQVHRHFDRLVELGLGALLDELHRFIERIKLVPVDALRAAPWQPSSVFQSMAMLPHYLKGPWSGPNLRPCASPASTVSSAFRSFIFFSAISRTCLRVTSTGLHGPVPAPFCSLAAFFRK